MRDLYEFREWIIKRERQRQEQKHVDAMSSIAVILTIILTIYLYINF